MHNINQDTINQNISIRKVDHIIHDCCSIAHPFDSEIRYSMHLLSSKTIICL